MHYIEYKMRLVIVVLHSQVSSSICPVLSLVTTSVVVIHCVLPQMCMSSGESGYGPV